MQYRYYRGIVQPESHNQLTTLGPFWFVLVVRSAEQARLLDEAGMTYVDAHIKISRMSFQNLSCKLLLFNIEHVYMMS